MTVLVFAKTLRPICKDQNDNFSNIVTFYAVRGFFSTRVNVFYKGKKKLLKLDLLIYKHLLTFFFAKNFTNNLGHPKLGAIYHFQ